MKKFNYLKKGAVLIGLLILSVIILKAQNATVNAYAFSSEPVIDGIIDNSWADNEYLQISHLLSSNTSISNEDFSGSFKLSWYNNNLYFLFVVTDDVFILNADMPIWYGDNINLYLDLGNEKSTNYDNNDYLCQFKWGNSEYYERFNGNDLNKINNSDTAIEFAQICDTVNHLYIMEIAIRNIADMNGPASLNESTTIGLDAGIYDSDEAIPGFYSDQLSWVDTTGYAWSDPSKLGTAGLGTATLKAAKSPNVIEELDEANPVKVYPTIVENILNIQTPLSVGLNVEIINMLGKKVESIDLTSENSGIDVSYLNAGLYYVNVYDSEGLIYSQKIILLK